VDSSTCVNKSFEKVEQTNEHQISQANSSTCGDIEPLKLTFSAQMTYQITPS
jgi:hypothetical protein